MFVSQINGDISCTKLDGCSLGTADNLRVEYKPIGDREEELTSMWVFLNESNPYLRSIYASSKKILENSEPLGQYVQIQHLNKTVISPGNRQGMI